MAISSLQGSILKIVNQANLLWTGFQNFKFFGRADLSCQIFAQNFDKPILQEKHNNCKFIHNLGKIISSDLKWQNNTEMMVKKA